jgi:hypothetical protein
MTERLLSKDTAKTFILYFTLAGIILLSINTYFLIENQTKILKNQEKSIPIVNDTNHKLTQMGENLAHLNERL